MLFLPVFQTEPRDSHSLGSSTVDMFYAYKKIKEHRQQKALAQQTPPLPADATREQTSSDASQSPLADDAPKSTKVKKERSPEEIADKKRRAAYRWKLIAGLCGPFALQALDTTIIASALSDIATEFRTHPLLLFPCLINDHLTNTSQTRSSSSTGSSPPSTSPRPPFSSSGRR